MPSNTTVVNRAVTSAAKDEPRIPMVAVGVSTLKFSGAIFMIAPPTMRKTPSLTLRLSAPWPSLRLKTHSVIWICVLRPMLRIVSSAKQTCTRPRSPVFRVSFWKTASFRARGEALPSARSACTSPRTATTSPAGSGAAQAQSPNSTTQATGRAPRPYRPRAMGYGFMRLLLLASGPGQSLRTHRQSSAR